MSYYCSRLKLPPLTEAAIFRNRNDQLTVLNSMVRSRMFRFVGLKVNVLLFSFLCICGLLRAQIPVVSAFSPVSAAAGATISLTGSNFNNNPVANIVFFGAVKGTVTSASGTLLKVIVPAGADYGQIMVLNTDNTKAGYSSGYFLPAFGGSSTGIVPSHFSTPYQLKGVTNAQLCIKDLNGDGKPEMAYAGGAETRIFVSRNSGTPGILKMDSVVSFAVGGASRMIQSEDLDMDGKPDIIATVIANTNTFTVLRNTTITGSGSLAFAGGQHFTFPLNGNFRIMDIDGDGKPDIVGINTNTGMNPGSLVIYRNMGSIGSISFAPALTLNLENPFSLSVGDFDRDGRADIAVGMMTSKKISFYRNTSSAGSVSLASPVDIPTSTVVPYLATGDMDGDGAVDILASLPNLQSISTIYRNTSTAGNIRFDDSLRINIPYNISAANINDYNGDGKPDISVMLPLNDSIAILTNTSQPNNLAFGPLISFVANSQFEMLASADLDGDSQPDIINPGKDPGDSIQIFRNLFPARPVITAFGPVSAGTGATITITGTGFTGVTSVTIGGTPATSFSILTSGTIPTIAAVVGVGSSGEIKVTTAAGTAALTGFTFLQLPDPPPVIASISPLSAAPGSNIVISGNNFDSVLNNLVVYVGGMMAQVVSASRTQLSVKVPDGSGYGFITVTNKTSGLTAYSALKFSPVFSSRSVIDAKDFSKKITLQVPDPGYTRNAVVTDIDGDGKQDVVAVHHLKEYVSVYRNLSTRDSIRFETRKDFVSGSGLWGIAHGDLDGDGKQDIVVSNTNESGNNGIAIFRNISSSGQVQFADKKSLRIMSDMPFKAPVIIDDVNRDGKPDIIATNGSGVFTYMNTTKPGDTLSFAYPSPYITINPDGLAIADINGDGMPDVLKTNIDFGKVIVLKNVGVSGESVIAYSNTEFPLSSQPIAVTAGDINSDGRNDIITASYSGNKISILKNTGTSNQFAFDADINYEADINPYTVTLADITGDGKPEMLAANITRGLITVLKNNTFTSGISFGGAVSITCDPTPTSVSVTDIDQDGKPDLLVTSGGGISILKNGGISEKPTITSCQPMSAAKGDVLTIAGTYLENINAITLGGVTVSSFKILSSTTLTAVVGNGASGQIRITNGTSADSLAGFIFNNPTDTIPDLQSFNPTAGGAGTQVSIKGKRFTGITEVRFGGITAAAFSITSDSLIVATVGTGASGKIMVISPKGKDSLGNFQFISQHDTMPVISSFAPASGSAGTQVSIKGRRFTGVTEIRFGGIIAAGFSVTNDSLIVAAVDTGASGKVMVISPKGKDSLGNFQFISQLQLDTLPGISSFAPLTAKKGNTVTIKGKGFFGTQVVSFGAVTATSFQVIADSAITAIIGNGASGDVSVVKAAGTSKRAGFIFDPSPTVTAAGTANICPGDSVLLISSDTADIQWMKDSIAIPNAVSRSYAAKTAGVYTVSKKINNTFYYSNKITANMYAAPVAGISIADSMLCLKDNNFHFTDSSRAGDTLTIASRQWNFGDNSSSGLRAPSHSYAQTGNYVVRLSVVNNRGCRDSTSVSVKVNAAPSVTIGMVPAVCFPATIDLTKTITGALPAKTAISYWGDSVQLTQLGNPGSVTVTGIYYVKVTDSLTGCSLVKPVQATINPLPVINPVEGDAVVCVGAKIVLKNSTPSGNWKTSDSSIALISSQGQVTGKAPGGTVTISYSVTDGNQCSAIVHKTVLVQAAPAKPRIAGYTEDSLVCYDDTLRLASQNTHERYLWSTGDSTSSILLVNKRLNISLRVGTQTGRCFSDSSALVRAWWTSTPKPVITKTNDSILTTTSAAGYKWYLNNKFLSGDTLARYTIKTKGIYKSAITSDRVCWKTSDDYIIPIDPATLKKPFVVVVYPNPSNGIFNVQVKFENTTSARISIAVMDVNGLVKWQLQKLLFNGRSIQIPVSVSLIPGTYTVRTEINGEISSQQLVIL
jgi:hypothetical protein